MYFLKQASLDALLGVALLCLVTACSDDKNHGVAPCFFGPDCPEEISFSSSSDSFYLNPLIQYSSSSVLDSFYPIESFSSSSHNSSSSFYFEELLSSEADDLESSSSMKDDGNFGRLVDSRDGKVYKTIQLGYQTWMAENLNFEMDSSYCFDDNMDLCDQYGRYYSAYAVDNACPMGSHLPLLEEWKELLSFIGGTERVRMGYSFYDIADELKTTSGWSNGGDGVDSYGLSIMPTGMTSPIYVGPDDEFAGVSTMSSGMYAYLWVGNDHYLTISYKKTEDMVIMPNESEVFMPVRCVLD